MIKKVEPLYDRVLLKPIEEEVSEAGIYLPKDTTERSREMVVVAVGNGKTDEYSIDMVVHPGERVLVAKYAGTEVIMGEKRHFIVKQCDILAKIS